MKNGRIRIQTGHLYFRGVTPGYAGFVPKAEMTTLGNDRSDRRNSADAEGRPLD